VPVILSLREVIPEPEPKIVVSRSGVEDAQILDNPLDAEDMSGMTCWQKLYYIRHRSMPALAAEILDSPLRGLMDHYIFGLSFYSLISFIFRNVLLLKEFIALLGYSRSQQQLKIGPGEALASQYQSCLFPNADSYYCCFSSCKGDGGQYGKV